MDKIDKLISIVRYIREEIAMTTASTAGKSGFGGSAQGFDPGPTAGYDKVIGFTKRTRPTIIGKGKLPGARKRWSNNKPRQ
jgi:hypothetical protein